MLAGTSHSFAAANQWIVNAVVGAVAGTAGDDTISTDLAGGAAFQPMNTSTGSDRLTFGANATNNPVDVTGVAFIIFGGTGIAFIDGDIVATGAGDDGIRATAGALTITISGTGSIAANNDAMEVGSGLNFTNNAGAAISGLNGVRASTTATINNSGSITGTNNGLTVTDGLDLTNNIGGSILGTNNGVSAGINAMVNNFGTIRGVNFDGIIATTTATITNSGTIMGAGDGVDAGNGLNLTNNAGATISGLNGIRALLTATVNNSGTITGTNNGVSTGNGLNLTNNVGGSITGTSTGVNTGTMAMISNAGLIRGINSIGIVATSTATITNSGTIMGVSAGINAGNDLNLTNSVGGTISGLNGVRALLTTTVNNSGTITGTNHGVDTGNGLNLTNNASGSITGTNNGVFTGTTAIINNAGTIAGTNFDGIFAGDTITINNSGTITGRTDDGVDVGNDAHITNNGIIRSTGTNGRGIEADTGTGLMVTNELGAIIHTDGTGGNSQAILAISGAITNRGEISTASAVTAAIEFTGLGMINNFGSITGGDDSVSAANGFNLTNNAGGTITGVNNGVSVGATATIDNSGTITGTNGDGILAGATTIIDNSGTITGGDDGVSALDGLTLTNNAGGMITGMNGDGVNGDNTVTISNFETITGGEDGVEAGDDLILINEIGATIDGVAGDGVLAGSNADIANDGSITGGDDGMDVLNDLVLVNNTGATIQGTTGDGVFAGSNADITNDSSITGGDDGVEAGDGLILTNNVSGIITGMNGSGMKIGNAATMHNFGEIRSMAADATAITAGAGLALLNECDAIIHTDGTGAGSQAILAEGGSITNRGTISTSSTLTAAIEFTGATNDTILHEGGSISSNGAYAIRMGGGDDTLTIRSNFDTLAACGPTAINGIMHGGDTNETNGDTLILDFIGYCQDDFNGGENGSTTHWGQTYTWEDFEHVELTGISFQFWGRTHNQQQIGRVFDCIEEFPEPKLLEFVQMLVNAGEAAFPEMANHLSPQRYEVFSRLAFANHDFTIKQLDHRAALLRENTATLWDTSALTLLDYTLDPKFEQMNMILTASRSMQAGVVRRATAPEPTPMSANRLGFFLSGNAILAQGDGTPDIYDYAWETYGILGGADYQLFRNFAVGIMGGYSHADVDLDDFGSYADIESYTAGAYLNWWWNHFYVNGVFSYCFNQYEGVREVPFLNKGHAFDTDGTQVNLGASGGYDFHLGSLTFGPTGGVRYVNFNADRFTEGGSGIDRLTVTDDNADSLRTSLGGRATYTLNTPFCALTPELRAAWGHEFFDDSRGITAKFNSSQLHPFTVRTTDPERDWAELGGSLRARFSETISMFVDYDAQLGQDDFFAHSVQGGVRVEF